MEILIFDMDGVLLMPHGYHRALQDTVRLASEQSGFSRVHLSQPQIHQFEALGIASEWHSSALCLAVLTLNHQTGENTSDLHLDPLFEALTSLPMSIIPRRRGETAISHLAKQAGIPAEAALAWIGQSEQIEHSLTLNLFQSMILGDPIYVQIYNKPARLQTESYLKQFDVNLLSEKTTARLKAWANSSGCCAAIMTNRPSFGPENILGAPDADFGAELVGLAHLPLIGYGETTWLAKKRGGLAAEVSKPNPEHALAAILAASGCDVKASLKFFSKPFAEWDIAALKLLRGAQITVFEDTPAGIISVQAAGELLNRAGLDVAVNKIGIAREPAKIAALKAVGAEIFPDINQALASLNHF